VLRGSGQGLIDGSVPSQPFRGGQGGVVALASGDFDGDGFDDVVVGGPGAGNIYLFRASAGSIGPQPEWTDTRPGTYGFSVAVADDINGDLFPTCWPWTPTGFTSATTGSPI
jgi:FG-GAP-like repeat